MLLQVSIQNSIFIPVLMFKRSCQFSGRVKRELHHSSIFRDPEPEAWLVPRFELTSHREQEWEIYGEELAQGIFCHDFSEHLMLK